MKRFLLTCTTVAAFAGVAAAAPQTMPNMQQMQELLKQSGLGNMSQQDMQRVMQMGATTMEIHQCAQGSVGKPAFERFMGEMNAVGKQVQGYCDQQKPNEARSLALATLQTKANDPVAVALKNCYQEKKPQLESALDANRAREFANYERWSEDPSLAAQEMQTSDICRYKTN
jgi:hypothetical protein